MDNTKKGKAEKKKSLVVEKQNKAVRNQVITLARMNFKSLGTFIRLIDYRVIETQVRINQEGADLIISEMDNVIRGTIGFIVSGIITGKSWIQAGMSAINT